MSLGQSLLWPILRILLRVLNSPGIDTGNHVTSVASVDLKPITINEVPTDTYRQLFSVDCLTGSGMLLTRTWALYHGQEDHSLHVRAPCRPSGHPDFLQLW